MLSVPVILVSTKLDGAPVAIRDGDQGCEMEHHLGLFHQFQTEVGIADIPGDYFQRRRHGKCIQPAPVVERVIQREGGNFRAALDEKFDQVRSNKAVGSGDEYVFRGYLHREGMS